MRLRMPACIGSVAHDPQGARSRRSTYLLAGHRSNRAIAIPACSASRAARLPYGRNPAASARQAPASIELAHAV
jgi:hypothetical protein